MNTDQPTWDFTSRELQIISYIQRGNSTKEIADQLSVSEYTIKRHRQNISKKADVSGKTSFRRFIKNYRLPPQLEK
ncbi:MAG: helix-turn-helix transcriptional regulator [Cytophagales bacterium]|jgi:DNA-binding NarL/FixJ family response regulator|nr:helix-turn-helix transcriptional regulator [Cytophagales bacterium]